MNVIKQTPSADWSINQLLSRIFISESRLRAHFRQITGVSLHEYIIRHKLLSAITEIISGTSVQDVAYGSGFTDASHLNKVMIKTFGIDPSMFLKNSQTFFVIPDNGSFKLETRLAL